MQSELEFIKSIKQDISNFDTDSTYEIGEFTFRREGAGVSDDRIKALDFRYYVNYRRTRVDEWSLNLMTAEEIKNAMDQMRQADPSSKDEWMNESWNRFQNKEL